MFAAELRQIQADITDFDPKISVATISYYPQIH